MRIGLAGVGHQGGRYLSTVKPSIVLRKSPGENASTCLWPETSDLRVFLGLCDAVIVATPVETHAGIVLAAMEAGKRALCEKPLCATWDELDNLREFAAPGQLTVGYTHLWHPQVERIVDRCTRERPERIEVRWDGDKSDALDWAPHAVAMAAACRATEAVELSFGNFGDPVQHMDVWWENGDGEHYCTVDDCCLDEPPLTRMVKWWLSGQQDYRSELWRRVEPAVLGLCGR